MSVGPWLEATRRDDESPCYLRRSRWYAHKSREEVDLFEIVDTDEYGLLRCQTLALQPAQAAYAAKRNAENLPIHAPPLVALLLSVAFGEHTRGTREGR